jgi:signal transduction histidine kinase
LKVLSLIVLLVLLHVAVMSSSAQSNAGLPFIHNFSPNEYGHGTQNFAVLQDKNGVLYFGNNNGVLVYDGHTWDLIQVSNQSEVHTLALDSLTGRIYVGGQGDFGFLENNKNTGRLEYTSIAGKLPRDSRNFNDVWNIYPTRNEVIFRSTAGIYIYRGDEVKVIKLSSSSHRSFYVYGELFLREENFGLRKMVNDSLVMIPQGDKFLNEPIHSIFPYPGNKYMIVTQRIGIFIYDGKTIEPFETPVNELIKGQNIYGQLLHDTTYALGTRANGLIIMNKKGEILYHLSKAQGLINESVWAVCADRFTGNLWVATNNGISFVEIESPFTGFQQYSGPPGQIYHMVVHNGAVYAASTFGVYYKKLNGSGNDAFQQIPDFNVQSWSFYKDETSLLVATNDGVFDITNNKPVAVGSQGRAWFLVGLKHHNNTVLANTANGFVIFEKQKGKFVSTKTIPRFFESLYYFVEDEIGNIWADSPIKGVYKIELNESSANEINYTLYNSDDGLPSDFKVMAFNYEGGVRFNTEKGIYRYDSKQDSMIFDDQLNQKLFGNERRQIEWMEQDSNKNIWFISKMQSGKNSYSVAGFSSFNPKSNSYKTNSDVFWRIHDMKIRDFLTVAPDEIFIASSEGIFHFQPSKIRTYNFPVVLRDIVLMKSDSSIAIPDDNRLYISHADNSVRFDFAGMSVSGNPHLYQCYLEGFDEQWQSWNANPYKEYTQLPAGEYVFHLKARNQYNQVSDELVMPFTVISPWYATPLAYTAYAFAVFVFAYMVFQWRSKSLIVKNIKLEKLVSERTAQIQKQHDDIVNKNMLLETQKEEIESQKDYIEKKNEELQKAKDIIATQNIELLSTNNNLEHAVSERTQELQLAYQNLLTTKNELDTFIYRSSHDIKGPLLRLLGLCNVARLEVKDDTGLYYFRMLEKEIRLTNRILQKLIVFYYVKNTDPQPGPLNLRQLIEKVLTVFHGEDGFSDVKFILDPGVNIEIHCDHYMLEVALRNIIENTIIYRAKENAQVTISVENDGSTYKLKVTDNGRGISDEVSGYIFDMFYRGSEQSAGAGLGLYITREALKKINGDIKLLRDKHTTFMITLRAEHHPEVICNY